MSKQYCELLDAQICGHCRMIWTSQSEFRNGCCSESEEDIPHHPWQDSDPKEIGL